MNLFDYKNYHFIGIGGIGISAIARMLSLQGKNVSGSDSNKSEITEDLEKLGIKIYIGHTAENLEPETEVVIYTIAAKDDNPELIEASKRSLICKTYPEALGELSKQMYTIAISGTHGKTTTTAMIGHIMLRAGMDPTIVVGSKMIDDKKEESGTNFIAGKSKYLVVEACEYKRSFLNLSPSILVITNIEADHLDYYKDLKDIKSAFAEMEARVPTGGFVVKENDYKSVATDFELLIPGKHNILDAQAAIKAVEHLGISNEDAKKYLQDFKGTWRRLEYKGEGESELKNMIFYDDYAHHPSEITASLNALKEKYLDRNVVCVFEAHQQSRTRLLFPDFVKSLQVADFAFIAPIFITREIDDHKTTNKKLAEEINKKIPAISVENIEELKQKLKELKSAKPLCVVLMGAGNIYKWTKGLVPSISPQ